MVPPYFYLTVLLAATPFVDGFVIPTPIPNGGVAFQGRDDLAATRPVASVAPWTRRHRRPDMRRSALGPDGNEIDIIRHREADSFPEYWDDFYAGGEAGNLQDGDSYDWFFGYSRMAVYLNLHIGGARAGRVLVLGCGNSEVSPKMWEDGWKNILNIDFCAPVIESMRQAHQDKPGLEWEVMDARDMAGLETASFDAVIDKGLTDAVMHNDNFAVMVGKVSYEVARVLKPGGVYLMTDYRDPERVQELFQRDEWEGGSLTDEGKITPTVNIFKGKRSTAGSAAYFQEDVEGEAGVEGDELEGWEEEASPEWLAKAMEEGVITMPDDAGPEVPPKDVGQGKPFKF